MHAGYRISWHPSKRNSALLSANIGVNACVRMGTDGRKPSSLPTRVGFMPMICHKTAEYGMGQERWKSSKKRTRDQVCLEGDGHNLFRLPWGHVHSSVLAGTEEGGSFRVLHLRAETVDEGPHPEEAAGPCSDVEAPSQQHFFLQNFAPMVPKVSLQDKWPNFSRTSRSRLYHTPRTARIWLRTTFTCTNGQKRFQGKRFPSTDAAVKALEAMLNRLSKPGFEHVFLD